MEAAMGIEHHVWDATRSVAVYCYSRDGVLFGLTVDFRFGKLLQKRPHGWCFCECEC